MDLVSALFERGARTPNRLSKASAGLFVIWGVIHVLVGAAALESFFTAGPAEMFAHSEIYVDQSEIDATLAHVGNVMAHYYFDILGLGILSIVVGLTLVWENDPLGLWINLVLLGLTDFAFVYLEIIPGYQPLFPQILAPIIFVLAVLFAAAGLLRAHESTA